MFASLRVVCTFSMMLVLASQSGCITLSSLLGQKRGPTLDTSLLEAQGYSIPPGGMPTQVSAAASISGPHIVMEIRGDERHLESIPMPMDQPVFVEDIVQQARLHEQFGKLSISIMRPNQAGGPPLRLDVQTNSSGRATSLGKNYALMPGDHLIVINDQRSSLEKFVDKQFDK